MTQNLGNEVVSHVSRRARVTTTRRTSRDPSAGQCDPPLQRCTSGVCSHYSERDSFSSSLDQLTKSCCQSSSLSSTLITRGFVGSVLIGGFCSLTPFARSHSLTRFARMGAFFALAFGCWETTAGDATRRSAHAGGKDRERSPSLVSTRPGMRLLSLPAAGTTEHVSSWFPTHAEPASTALRRPGLTMASAS